MLVYEYPPKLSHGAKQAKAIRDLEQHARIRRNMIRNLLLAAVLIVIACFVGVIIIKLLLIMIGAANAAVGMLLYWYGMLSFDENVYSRIYDDHLEHSQTIGLSKRYLHINIAYKDIRSSEQDSRGNLIVRLNENNGAVLFTTDENGQDKQDFYVQGDALTLKFVDTKAKLTLVNDLYEQINYPHKQYNVIDDDDDDYYTAEDKKWDSFGKHGL